MSLVLGDVSYTYPGTKHGLHHVSFSIESGELLAVIGQSGSGKSTLLKLIAGLASGHTGTITLNDTCLSEKPVHQRNIGVVFQNYALFPHLDVMENIAYGLKLRGVTASERARRAIELLDVIGMRELAKRSVRQLSGGQQQRVALARALAINPGALLLDEPLAALDASIRGHLRDQIRQLQKKFNATTLLVTHDQEEALTMADRIAVLKEGRLLQLATPKELYEAPLSCEVAKFVGLSSIFPGRVFAMNRVDLGFAVLSAETGVRSVGDPVHVLIRPEHVEADPAPEAINRLPGKTVTVRYFGSTNRYDFQIPGADIPLLSESRVVAAHAVAVAPEHIRLLDQ